MGDLSRKSKSSFEELCLKQDETMRNPTQQNMRAESEAYKRWDFVSEEKVLKQKSKMHWLNVGDKNNSVPRSNSKGNCKLHKGDRVCRWRDSKII